MVKWKRNSHMQQCRCLFYNTFTISVLDERKIFITWNNRVGSYLLCLLQDTLCREPPVLILQKPTTGHFWESITASVCLHACAVRNKDETEAGIDYKCASSWCWAEPQLGLGTRKPFCISQCRQNRETTEHLLFADKNQALKFRTPFPFF